MHFVADQIIAGIAPGQYERLYFDEPFNEALCVALQMRRRLDQRESDAAQIVRRVAIAPRRDVPRVLRPVLGKRRIEYTEAVVYRWGSMRGQWTLEPGLMAERVRGSGTFSFAEQGGGTRRIVQGELTIALPGIGKLAERLVVEEVERSYRRAAEFTTAYLADRPPRRG